eukprot:COSAG02_NODE_49148_length_328_cov_1.786026_1_plen_88_part_01
MPARLEHIPLHPSLQLPLPQQRGLTSRNTRPFPRGSIAPHVFGVSESPEELAHAALQIEAATTKGILDEIGTLSTVPGQSRDEKVGMV